MMGCYLSRRFAMVVPSLIGITVVLFTLLALAPGAPFSELALNPNIPPEVAASLRFKFGVDDPVAVQYLRWLWAMLHGDWGFSFVSHMDVATLIAQRLPVTLAIIGSSQILAALIAIPVGVYSAVRAPSIVDNLISSLACVGLSLPTFITGLLFILTFSIYLDWVPSVFHTDISISGWRWYGEYVRQAILPVAVLALYQAALWIRVVRYSVLDVLRLDHVTTARAKGMTERAVISRHAFRIALIPIVTMVALQMPMLLSGAIVTEQIFRIPGMGALLIDSILVHDTPVVMAVTFLYSCAMVVSNVLADVINGWLDPRIVYR